MKRRNFLTNFCILSGSLTIPTILNGCKKGDIILSGKQQIEEHLNNLNQLEANFNKAAKNYIARNNCWNCKNIFIVSLPKSSPKSKRIVLQKFRTNKSIDFNIEGLIFKAKNRAGLQKPNKINIEGEEYYLKVYSNPRGVSIPIGSPKLGQSLFSYITADMLSNFITIQTIKF